MDLVLLIMFLMPVLLFLIAWYVVSSIISYKYIKACNGDMAWMAWLPLNLRMAAICLASDNIHPLRIPRWVLLVLGLLTLAGLPFWWVPYLGSIMTTLAWIAVIALFIFYCIYIYNVASDLDKSAVFYVVMFILFNFIAEPFILHSMRKGVEEMYEV